MAEFGLEVRDADGNITLDNQHLTHRLWHWGIYSANANVTYSAPLNHEPTVMATGINGYGHPVEHKKSGSQFTGFIVKPHFTFGGAPPPRSASESIVVVFARE